MVYMGQKTGTQRGL